jgi:hypothetical protein
MLSLERDLLVSGTLRSFLCALDLGFDVLKPYQSCLEILNDDKMVAFWSRFYLERVISLGL